MGRLLFRVLARCHRLVVGWLDRSQKTWDDTIYEIASAMEIIIIITSSDSALTDKALQEEKANRRKMTLRDLIINSIAIKILILQVASFCHATSTVETLNFSLIYNEIHSSLKAISFYLIFDITSITFGGQKSGSLCADQR